MSTQAVHWHEGMFLRPNHFQAQDRHAHHAMARGDSWNCEYNWGLRQIRINPDALANNRFKIDRLEARLRDGTTVVVPDEAALGEPELRAALEREPRLVVHLGVPVLRLGAKNDDREGRFKAEPQELQDENSADSPLQEVQTRSLRAKLFLGDEDQAGYEAIPIARIRRQSDARNTPEIDPSFIPPLLVSEAWEPLRTNILQSLFDRVGAKAEMLASLMISRGIPVNCVQPEDALTVGQLQLLNSASAALDFLISANGLHPLAPFRELGAIVGGLAIYGDSRRPPRLPAYNHDGLGDGFSELKRLIDGYLDLFVEPGYKRREFIGVGSRMQVTLEPAWLEPGWKMFVAVKSDLPPQDMVNKIGKNGLDVKIGSSESVDRIFNFAMPGLLFTHQTTPPRALPAEPGLIYFEIQREGPQKDEWSLVRKNGNLAVRFNHTKIDGTIEGQKTLKLRPTGNSIEFILFALKAT